MHQHSLEAFLEITQDGSKDSRRMAILEVVRSHKQPLRDWDILQILFPGSDDLNKIRPRCSELHEDGLLCEGPPMRSHSGHRNVRTSIAVNNEHQQSLFT